MDFWSGFRNGIRKTNIEHVLADLPLIRERTLNLWDSVTQRDLRQEAPRSVIDRVLQRIRYSKPARRGRVDIPSQLHPALFTEMRMSHRLRELEFVGIDQNGKEYILKVLIRRIVRSIDRLYEYLSGHPYRTPSVIEVTHPAKAIKVFEIFLNAFFSDVGFESISIKLQPMSLIALLRLSAERRKLAVSTAHSFMFNLLYFAVIVRRQTALLRGEPLENERVLIQNTQMRVDQHLLFRIEMHFENELISKTRFDALDSGLDMLVQSDTMRAGNFTFHDLPRNNGELFLLDVLVLFANMKGGCGVEYAQENVRSGQTIFCVWDPNQEPIMKHSHRFQATLPNERFDDPHDPEQGTQFVDSDLLLQIGPRFDFSPRISSD